MLSFLELCAVPKSVAKSVESVAKLHMKRVCLSPAAAVHLHITNLTSYMIDGEGHHVISTQIPIALLQFLP